MIRLGTVAPAREHLGTSALSNIGIVDLEQSIVASRIDPPHSFITVSLGRQAGVSSCEGASFLPQS